MVEKTSGLILGNTLESPSSAAPSGACTGTIPVANSW